MDISRILCVSEATMMRFSRSRSQRVCVSVGAVRLISINQKSSSVLHGLPSRLFRPPHMCAHTCKESCLLWSTPSSQNSQALSSMSSLANSGEK